MKRGITLLLAVVMLLSLAACGKGENEIPDVFGVDYTAAVGILEAEGFAVSAVETSVDSFSDKLLYPLEKVDKGTVFKVDDYIIDGNGNLNKNYDVFYEDGLISDNKSVVIYYAKEDYIREDKETADTTPAPTETAAEPSSEETTPATTEAKENKDDDTIDPDFKAAMDSYEKFMDEYVAFMKKYKDNPTDLSLLSDYADYMSKYADFVEDFEDWENEDLNAAELAYYVDVQARVSKKLLEAV